MSPARHLPAATRATLVGSGAILLWSALTLLVTFVPGVPPFQLVALTFLIGSVVVLLKWYM
ncbi:MAG: EamA family transporter, partial [Alphaproteobacteria bacterium]|nr:EamA family transporter [Alphaproteobacteria bacterium]